jgi:uncharacterized repeat protein (TIGR01451 family)
MNRIFRTAAAVAMVLTSLSSVSTAILGGTTPALAASQSANLDQWGNLTPASWVNGNLGASKSTYYEGDSIPYRMTFSNLTGTSHKVVIQWDTTKGGKHALDYLTGYNYTNQFSRANQVPPTPCANAIPYASCGSPTTFAIPQDPNVPFAQAGGVQQYFTMYNGTITAASAYTVTGTYAGDSSTSITLTFTATGSNALLAWGGHISTRKDWGLTNSAVAVPGSPYHTRLISLDGSGGNQDRSLSAAAVIFPGSITIVKTADVQSNTSFGFTATPNPPLSNFSLKYDATPADGTKTFGNITNFQTYTIVEGTGAWTLNSITCSAGTSTNGGTATTTVSTGTAAINMQEGENWTCTYSNTLAAPNLSILKQAWTTSAHTTQMSSYAALGDTVYYTFLVSNTGNVPVSSISVTDSLTSGTAAGLSSVSCPSTPTTLYPASQQDATHLGSITCTATYVVQQADIDQKLNILDTGCVTGSSNGNPVPATGTICSSAEVDNAVPNTGELDIAKIGTATHACTQGQVDLPSGPLGSSLCYQVVNDTISYSYTVTNNTNQTFYPPFTVTDDKINGGVAFNCGAQNVTHAPGTSWTCSSPSTYAVTQGDIDSGSVTNTAYAFAFTYKQQQDCLGGFCSPTSGGPANATIFANQNPSVGFLKQIAAAASLGTDCSTLTYSSAVTVSTGGAVCYKFTITNAGNTTLTGPFNVVDPTLFPVAPHTIQCGSATTLAPAATIVCYYGAIATSATPGAYPNTATACDNLAVDCSPPSTSTYYTIATHLAVSAVDSLTGLPNTSNGTVLYSMYTDSACTAGRVDDPNTMAVTAGSVASSDPFSVPNGTKVWFQATWSPNTVNGGPVPAGKTTCSDESVLSISP